MMALATSCSTASCSRGSGGSSWRHGDLTFHFLRKPRPGDLIGEGRLLRLGRSLAAGEATIFSEGEAEPVAHAVGTYAIPQPKRP
jgi:acyl-coenzyme A thioesterase PaaI-like protein